MSAPDVTAQAAGPQQGVPAVPAAAAPSEGYRRWLQRRRRDRWAVRGGQLALLVAVLVAWEVLARSHIINPMLTSYPSAVWPILANAFDSGESMRQGSLLMHSWVTLVEVVISFVLTVAMALAIAVALWWSTFLYRVLDPYLVIANAMPKIAFAPIFFIWLGSDLSIYGITVAIAIFITTLMIYTGFRETDPSKVKLLKSLGANRRQVLTSLVIPGNVPTILAALKAAIGLVLVGVVIGEFQSAQAGLGYLIIYGSQIFQMNLVMAAITILAAISTVMYLAVAYTEAVILRGRYQSHRE